MEKELIIKTCTKCGATIKVLKDCTCSDCDISCCNEKMVTLKPNSTDAAFEKHVPTYEIKDGNLIVSVNHVMDPDHYIEWIALINDDNEDFFYLNPGDNAKVTFKNKAKGTLYAYCNKHGLWEKEIN